MDTALLSVLEPTVLWLALVVVRLLARELGAAANKTRNQSSKLAARTSDANFTLVLYQALPCFGYLNFHMGALKEKGNPSYIDMRLSTLILQNSMYKVIPRSLTSKKSII